MLPSVHVYLCICLVNTISFLQTYNIIVPKDAGALTSEPSM